MHKGSTVKEMWCVCVCVSLIPAASRSERIALGAFRSWSADACATCCQVSTWLQTPRSNPHLDTFKPGRLQRRPPVAHCLASLSVALAVWANYLPGFFNCMNSLNLLKPSKVSPCPMHFGLTDASEINPINKNACTIFLFLHSQRDVRCLVYSLHEY